MSHDHVLVTGGAGFIGTALVRELLQQRRRVRVLDSLLSQVHGADAAVPSWMAEACDVRLGDVRDAAVVAKAVEQVDVIVHLASETGTGQSMYAMRRHSDVNVTGTATLLEAIARQPGRVRRLVLASSRAIYGEGRYRCASCGVVYPHGRDERRLRQGLWDPVCPRCSGPIGSEPTDEDSALRPTSVYGATKLAQELLVTNFGRATGIETVALRLQNVYGEGQSLANPYTGILTHFVTAVSAGQAPRVFEDGRESRDFVHVDDVVGALVRALESQTTLPSAINVGSGTRTTILRLAHEVCAAMQSSVQPEVIGEYRVGDIRHCVADVRLGATTIDVASTVDLATGVGRFVAWARQQAGATLVSHANDELARAGLLRRARV